MVQDETLRSPEVIVIYHQGNINYRMAIHLITVKTFRHINYMVVQQEKSVDHVIAIHSRWQYETLCLTLVLYIFISVLYKKKKG